jgi:hypothetical protein
MPENYIQVLILLAANPAGLTTDQILKQLKKVGYNGVKDIQDASNVVFSMRAKTLLTSSDAVGGKIHKISEQGKAELEAHISKELSPAPVQPKPSAAPEKQPEPDHADSHGAPVCEISQTDSENSEKSLDSDDPQEPIDILQQFDSAVEVIRDGLIAALDAQAAPVRITDKPLKIELLDKLVSMPLENRVIELLREIRADLEIIDAA